MPDTATKTPPLQSYVVTRVTAYMYDGFLYRRVDEAVDAMTADLFREAVANHVKDLDEHGLTAAQLEAVVKAFSKVAQRRIEAFRSQQRSTGPGDVL